MLDVYIRQYGTRLYGLCRTLCRNTQDADDLYQETWLKALAHLDQYNPAQPFEPWLTRICVNTYRSTLRRLGHSPIWDRFSTNEEKDALLESVPAEEARGEEAYADLHQAIDRLPEKLRVAVILFYFRGMDLTSAAMILGVPAGTMKSRLNHARKKLKEALEREADLPF